MNNRDRVQMIHCGVFYCKVTGNISYPNKKHNKAD